MDEELVKSYMTSEVATILGVSQSTVRNYSIALERYGYAIAKPKRSRLFVEQDVATLMRMKELKASLKLPLNDIAEIIGTTPTAPATPSEMSDAEVKNNTVANELLAAMMDEITVMKKENAALKQEVKRNTDHINVIIHEVRRTNSLLFKALSEQPEQKKRPLFWKLK